MNLYKLTMRKSTKYNLKTSQQDNPFYNKQVSLVNRKWSYLSALNGFLTGMVAVSGAGDALPSWAAFLAGLVGGLAFFMLSGLLRLNKLDDPVSGVAVNLGGGVVGALVTGLTNLVDTYDGTVVAWQVVGLVVVATWTTVCCLVVMLPLLLCGKLRIKDCQERMGVDIVKMEEQAYPDLAKERKILDAKVLTNRSQGGVSGKVEREKNP